MIRARPPALAALLVSVALAGCAAPRVASPVAALPARPLAPPVAAGERAVSQVVRGAVGAREMMFNCVVSVRDGVMSVVGLNPLGVRLFTIRYDGAQVSVDKSFAVPDALTPDRLLADLQLVYWPLKPLQETLRPAGYELTEPTAGTRSLRRGDRLVAEAHYATTDAWSGRAWLVNLEHGYSLQIDSAAP